MSTKLDIISGFLGAGKTTLINKLLNEAYADEKVALLENEFGEIGVDGDILREQNISVKEISNGCICCTLQGDFIIGIKELVQQYSPDRIVIEPTGISRLRDILKACSDAAESVSVQVNSTLVVVNAVAYPALSMVGGEFFVEQISDAHTILISAVQDIEQGEMSVDEIISSIRGINKESLIIATPYDDLDGLEILAKAEQREAAEGGTHEHEAHEHEAHHHDDHCEACGEDEHHHHDDIDGFSSVSFMIDGVWPDDGVDRLINGLGEMGEVFRVKGFIPTDSGMVKLDYVYGILRTESSGYKGDGKLVIIGRRLDEESVKMLVHMLGSNESVSNE